MSWYNEIDFVVDGQPLLMLGHQGDDVKRLQTQLNAQGANLALTGEFDETTDQAVRRFQQQRDLVDDGAVGIKTRQELNRLSSVPFYVLRQGDQGAEVRQLQYQLRQAGHEIGVDGDFGPTTERVLRVFQTAQGLVPTGEVDQPTYQLLNTLPKNVRLLTRDDLQWAADALDVPLAAVMAINEVESRGSGFFSNGKPAILYERHIMRRRLLAEGVPTAVVDRFQRETPTLVNRKTGGYQGGVREHVRLQEAKQYSEKSALESCSWGLFQIMGFHWEHLGYRNVEHFVEEMHRGERQQLEAFVRFIRADSTLHRDLQALQWAKVARRYNGPGYAKNRYDVKLASAFDKHTAAMQRAA